MDTQFIVEKLPISVAILDLKNRLKYIYKMWKDSDDERFIGAMTRPDSIGKTLFTFIVNRFYLIHALTGSGLMTVE